VSLFAKSSTILLVLMTAVPAGCSGGGGEVAVPFKKAGPPPPARCLERYNKDSSALALGKHAYSRGHNARSARVTSVNEPENFIKHECLVVYADDENDRREYGTLGQFSSANGWLSITDFPVKSEKERIALQRTGAERANAKLNPDGTLSRF
jgi:hypothetical protein